MTRAVRALLRDQCGATAIEYGLIMALMAIASLGAFNLFGHNLQIMWNNVAVVVTSH